MGHKRRPGGSGAGEQHAHADTSLQQRSANPPAGACPRRCAPPPAPPPLLPRAPRLPPLHGQGRPGRCLRPEAPQTSPCTRPAASARAGGRWAPTAEAAWVAGRCVRCAALDHGWSQARGRPHTCWRRPGTSWNSSWLLTALGPNCSGSSQASAAGGIHRSRPPYSTGSVSRPAAYAIAAPVATTAPPMATVLAPFTACRPVARLWLRCLPGAPPQAAGRLGGSGARPGRQARGPCCWRDRSSARGVLLGSRKGPTAE